MSEKIFQDKLKEAEARLFSPAKQADIVKGTVNLAMSLSAHFDLSPEDVGDLLANLDDSTANGIAYLYGTADGRVVKDVGRTLQKKG